MTYYKILHIVFYNFSLVVGIRKSDTSYFMPYCKILLIVVHTFSLVVGIRKSDTWYFITYCKIIEISKVSKAPFIFLPLIN